MDYVISIPDQLTPQVRSLRKARGLSQKDLAVRLGVSQSRIAAIESNPSSISVGQLMGILAILDVQLVLRDRQAPVTTNPGLDSGKADSVKGGEW
jgi:HTH-type transcriptional regulator/antitoxin HipB